MKSFACLLFLCLVALLDGKRFRCDYTYMPEADGWLKLHRIPANWQEARLRCHLEGGNLISPLNNGLRQAMKNMIARDVQPKCGVFTGIHATFSKGDFFSIEGVPLWKIPHSWAENEPDNFKDQESCIVMFADGNFADVNCKEPFPYICYKQSQKNVFLNNCGTIDNGYSLETRTGSCYKFHRIPRTWSGAHMACAAEGAYLTIINSEVESQVIREIFAKNPGGSMLGVFWKDIAFVGFHGWNKHGDWTTVDGRSLEEAGYAKFSGGEPNNATTGEYCGGVYRNGMYDDIWCENGYAFICEKSPNSLLCEEDEL